MTISQLLREPLTHFFLLAALLFLVEQVVSSTQKTRIVIDRQTADFLIAQREELELKTLSAAERTATIDTYVEEEILYNEAYRRGLDRGDSRMRRNLILKMRGLLTGELEEPTEEDLKAYFNANRERFTRPASLDLEQVYFKERASVPDGLLRALNEGVDATGMSDENAAQPLPMPALTAKMIVGMFGADAAKYIISIDDGLWHGPLESVQGLHFVRIVARRPEQAASYERVQQYLRGDWLMDRARRIIQDEVARLRPDYEIIIETDS